MAIWIPCLFIDVVATFTLVKSDILNGLCLSLVELHCGTFWSSQCDQFAAMIVGKVCQNSAHSENAEAFPTHGMF